MIIESLAELEIADMSRPDWDHYFGNLAEAVSLRADCRRRQVGCIIVDENFRVISKGYNGAPAGDPGCLSGACPRGLLDEDHLATFTDYDRGPGKCISLHAEANALLYAGREVRGGTAYVNYTPCPTCTKLLAGAGIRRVVVV
jgi:dCMP deaminase